MRLFIAIPMPESVKERLVELQQPIEGIRWEQSEKFHITLKFLGDTEFDSAQKLQSVLNKIEIPPFSITLNGLGYFPKGKQPRVLWAGVKKNDPIKKLHSQIEDKCTDLGFEPENRSFKPHITIGRVKGASKKEITSFIEEHEKFRIPEVQVDEFVLFESKLHADGAKHFRKKAYSLSEPV